MAADTASCPLEWELFLPEERADDELRRRRAGVPDQVGSGCPRRVWR
nr:MULTISPECIES: transposase [unclassified Streptomyces]